MEACDVWKAADGGDGDEVESDEGELKQLIPDTWQRHHGRRMGATLYARASRPQYHLLEVHKRGQQMRSGATSTELHNKSL